MDLALDAPINYLKYVPIWPGRFAIASVASQSDRYLSFYREAAKHYTVILDNGVFESHHLTDKEYFDVAETMFPHVIVAPDRINSNADENYKRACDFARKFSNSPLTHIDKPTTLMCVIQCEKEETIDFWTILDTLLNDPKFEYIGICRDAIYNAFGHFTNATEQETNRFYFVTELQRRYTVKQIMSKKWHFLGIGEHVHLLQYYWFVNSMDSASAFYQGVLGNLLSKEGIMPATLRRPRDYFIATHMWEDQWEHNVEANCREMLRWAEKAGQLKRRILGGRL
jgi:hypothetical protein